MSFLSILDELLASSSSSSDDDEVQMLCVAEILKQRDEVMKLKEFDWIILNEYDDETFRQHLRLTRASFDKLVSMFRSSRFMPKFAGTKQVIRIVAHQFDVSLSSFHRIFTRVVMFLFELSPRFIQLPSSPEQRTETARQFQLISGFPNVIGCIDGCYIPIQTPARKAKSTYVNRHHQTALTLQGVCDSKCKFLDVCTGFSSKMNDSQVFKLSFIYREIKTLCGPDDTYHFLGDEAYPISSGLLTPFRHVENLTDVQARYNKAFSKTRVKIENAFRLLKGRFRQLKRLDFHSVERASYFIVACCVLHNLCIDWGEENFVPEDEDAIANDGDSTIGNQDDEKGNAKRDFIAMNTQFLE